MLIGQQGGKHRFALLRVCVCVCCERALGHHTQRAGGASLLFLVQGVRRRSRSRCRAMGMTGGDYWPPPFSLSRHHQTNRSLSSSPNTDNPAQNRTLPQGEPVLPSLPLMSPLPPPSAACPTHTCTHFSSKWHMYNASPIGEGGQGGGKKGECRCDVLWRGGLMGRARGRGRERGPLGLAMSDDGRMRREGSCRREEGGGCGERGCENPEQQADQPSTSSCSACLCSAPCMNGGPVLVPVCPL